VPDAIDKQQLQEGMRQVEELLGEFFDLRLEECLELLSNWKKEALGKIENILGRP
jgi:hypothetical protein